MPVIQRIYKTVEINKVAKYKKICIYILNVYHAETNGKINEEVQKRFYFLLIK